MEALRQPGISIERPFPMASTGESEFVQPLRPLADIVWMFCCDDTMFPAHSCHGRGPFSFHDTIHANQLA